MKNTLVTTALRAALLLSLTALLTLTAQAQQVQPATTSPVEIPASQLPTAVRQAIAKQYAGYRVDDARKISGGKAGTTYRVELEGTGKKEMHVVFNAAGKVLRSTTETERDD
ncbi:PepSY-like domain-containing protein [Hymenobacter sp. DH14]|uniref:PepSY-like domain-containing protein n=1 Tax=Hymenobacter cyanobacteriorum TaxID=2926463 RepID=A0A9X2AI82_9BACT|nr:PepSY-like domain-containing protein [Hymenobacter cyanobacteriorum]MCI1189683.1 PepSY-like domain-containing protein [Hymenobacter cyanobacteriorum]